MEDAYYPAVRRWVLPSARVPPFCPTARRAALMLRPLLFCLLLLTIGCADSPQTDAEQASAKQADLEQSGPSATGADVAAEGAGVLPVVVYKSPTCGCCVAWAAHMDSAGRYAIKERDVADLSAVKAHLGVPPRAASCHTATVDGLVIEGHVPEPDVARLLAERPDGVVGLSVPGMPVGSPGMEVPGQPAQAYDVLALHADGSTSVFARH